MKLNLDNLTVNLSKKSFHYKFMKFILRGLMPDLYTLCPYFWLFIFCVVTSPITVPFVVLVDIIAAILNFLDNKVFIPAWEKFFSNLSDEDFYNTEEGVLKKKVPFVFDTTRRNKSDSLYNLRYYITERYNLSYDEYFDRVENGRKLAEARNAKIRKEIELKRENERKRTEKFNKVKNFLFGWIPKISFTFKKLPLAAIIRWTKRVFTIAFTVAFLAGVYWVAMLLINLFGTFSLGKFLIILKNLGIALVILAISLTVIYYIVIGVIYLINNGYFDWMGPVGRGIAWIFVGLWKCLTAPFIFGWQYFKATKNDYCPGIIWDDEK